MSNWRSNANLVECFENWRATVRGVVVNPPLSEREQWAKEIKTRRLALGLSQLQLEKECGCCGGVVGPFERASSTSAERYRQLSATLDRLETERRTVTAR